MSTEHSTHNSLEENLYPVINVNQGLWNPLLTKFRRGISSFNPFATQQIPSHDRMALGARWGNQFYVPDPYPNGATFYRMGPSHYDPLEGMNRGSFPLHHRSHGPGSELIPVIKADKYPRGCVRTIQSLKRCQIVNGNNCEEEAQEILNVCPRWVLEDMAEKKRFRAKVTGIQNKLYASAMKVSAYNEGRNVSELEIKNWNHGTRENLRPDTMWADARYANITQQEINEAKVRHASREAKKVHHKEHEHHHYDWVEAKKRETAPLYP